MWLPMLNEVELLFDSFAFFLLLMSVTAAELWPTAATAPAVSMYSLL